MVVNATMRRYVAIVASVAAALSSLLALVAGDAAFAIVFVYMLPTAVLATLPPLLVTIWTVHRFGMTARLQEEVVAVLTEVVWLVLLVVVAKDFDVLGQGLSVMDVALRAALVGAVVGACLGLLLDHRQLRHTEE
jgi:hypothetical protein